MKKVWRVLRYVLLVLFILYALLVAWRMNDLKKKDITYGEVIKIHNTKLTLDDVYGKNLPPAPTNPDATVVGIDANKNNIRDDVELAIFQKYPNSAKTRAVLLQYAMALQMEVLYDVSNTEIATAIAEDSGRAYVCIGDVVSRENSDYFDKVTNELTIFVDSRQINTEVRKQAQKEYIKNVRSYGTPFVVCDIDLSKLEN